MSVVCRRFAQSKNGLRSDIRPANALVASVWSLHGRSPTHGTNSRRHAVDGRLAIVLEGPSVARVARLSQVWLHETRPSARLSREAVH